MHQSVPVQKQEKKLADYQVPDFLVDNVYMEFDLQVDHALVTSKVTYHRNGAHHKTLILDGGQYMELLSVHLDGSLLSADQYVLGKETLELKEVPDNFVLEIMTRLKPHENTRLEGLYHSGGNFCTQCEAEGFRHITYYLDRPDVLARFTVRIEADQEAFPILLSNGNKAEEAGLENGRHYAIWDDPFPKPSYLFALVAGNLACLSDTFTTKSGKKVDLNIYVARDDLDKSQYAMGALQRAMKWDEDVFGLEYDLDIYNIVAVSDFNMGAMENKGLNVFNTKYVLASPETATDGDFGHVEGVIGHEYFHNWTGNRVTCRDWFQLSLKEGLTVFRDQEFSSDMTSRAVKRLDDVRVLRLLQFAEDAGPLAHPVRPETYIEINNFYTVTVYNKGAEVIRMMHTLLGPSAFRKGMDQYFARHDGQAVTCEDFVLAMEAASGQDLSQFRLWYSQAGTPVVSVKRERIGKTVRLTLEQTCPATPGQNEKKPFHMPFLLGWLDAKGAPLKPALLGEGTWAGDTCCLDFKSSKQIYEFHQVPEGAVLSLHRQFSAPVKLEHDLTDEELAFLVGHDKDPYTRWEAFQGLASKQILNGVEGKKDPVSEQVFMNAFRLALEDKESDPAFISELLTLPSEIDVGQKMTTLDAEGLKRSRMDLLTKLAQANADVIRAQYVSLKANKYALEPKAIARRRLKNTFLSYLVLCEGGMSFAMEQYKAADNMTDSIAALVQVANSDAPERKAILDHFYAKWADNALVIDKWFAVQAQSRRDDTVKAVHDLIKHHSFSIKNPNRVRSVVSSFSMVNQAAFHEKGGAGYRFLAEMIIKVDAYNPQTAAKLVAPLGRWKRVNSVAAELMKQNLQWIHDTENISDDVKELCLKSLK